MTVDEAVALVYELSEHQSFRDDPVVNVERETYHELLMSISAKNTFLMQPLAPSDAHCLRICGAVFKVGPVLRKKEIPK